VQALGNPQYLNHLAAQKLLVNPDFVAYLDYLQYWSRPPYLKYLTYPAPTLKVLQLLQKENFRRQLIDPGFCFGVAEEWAKAAVEWHRPEKKDVKSVADLPDS
jgi:mediator of RNA polymerase II transcription subunit 31